VPDPSLLARTFLIGIAVAAPVGAMGVLCIQRTLGIGWRAGAVTGLGIATADGLYAAIAAFGLSAVSGALVAVQTPLRFLGGAALVYFGIRAMTAQGRECTTGEQASTSASAGSLYASSVALTLTNPMTVMAFAAVFASAGLAVAGGWSSAVVATVGVATGSLTWWLGLTAAVALARRTVGPHTMTWVNRLSGAAVALFGIAAVVSALF